ncbi:MAG: ankyrin repeat domain-containing protein [Bacteroidota bacterium]
MQNLFDAIRAMDLSKVAQILNDNPKTANSTDPKGFTPLILAAYVDAGDIVDHLLDRGANINAQDAIGNTALMGVCFKGNKDLAIRLIQKGADIDISNHKGQTAIDYARQFGHDNLVDLLNSH